MKQGYATEMGEKNDPFNLAYDIKLHPGWVGAHTTQNAPGAMPAGTKIVKSVDEVGDKHTNGAEGVVLGSIPVPETGMPITKLGPVKFFYWVEWSDHPRYAVGVVSPKIKEKS